MRKMFIFIASLMLSLVMFGQTVLINPAQEGGFELGPDFASNGWTLVNGAQTNQWFVGTVPGSPNNNSAYVSNDGGVSWAYTITTAAVVHFYRDITFPAGETDIQLTFLLRGIGESSFDRLRIYLVPTTTTPVAGTELAIGNQVGLANYNFQGQWIKVGFTIPASAAGTTQRLVFSWRNDSGGGTAPPVSIDNIALVSQTPYTMAGIYTIDNTLPTAGTNFNNFNDAVLTLNSAIIAGPITFIVTSGQQFIEILPVITATGTSANTITFTKSGIANPIILSGGFSGTTDAIVAIRGGDYFTFNGFDLGLADPSQNTVENGYYVINASATDGAQFNTFTNTNIALNRTNTTSRGVYQNVAITPTAATGANSNNTYSNINVSNSYNGIVCTGIAGFPDLSTVINNCIVGADSPNDIGNGTSAISGIRIASGRDVMVYENIVRNLTTTGATNVFGIFMENIQGNSQIYKNKVYNLTSTSVSTSAYLQGIRADVPATFQASVHNNVVYGFSHAITTPSATMVARGIAANVTGTGSVGITYNSVHINLGPAATSTALWTGGGTHAITNNIFANTSAAGATSTRFSIYRSGTGVLISNYNDLYIEPGTNNFVGYFTANQIDLAAWQVASGGDLNSVNANPIFTGSPDLMPSNPAVNNLGTVVPITDDITGAPRDPSTPDMGAYEFTPPSCLLPIGLTATSITNSSALLGWSSSAALWNVEVGLAGFTPGMGASVVSVTGTTNNPWTASPLAGNTQYEFYVMADCGGGDLSAWAGPFAFTTLCDISVDFFENFDGVATPTLPACWNKITALGNAYTQTASNFSAPNCLYMFSSTLANTAVVSMPPVSNLQAETHRLRFMGRGNISANAIVEVGYLTNPIDPLTFVLISSVTLTTLTYEQYIVTPTGIPAGVTTLAFRTNGTPASSLLIDDVRWEVIPACPAPTTLTATGITATSANLGWTSGASSWNVEVGLPGFTPGTGAAVVSATGTANNPWLASGLTASTAYQFYVQADCGGSGLSTWAGPFAFFTGYCQVSTTSQLSWISNFVTSGGVDNITHSAAAGAPGGYQNLTSSYVSNYIGQSTGISLTAGGPTVGFAIWIDWNNNLIFEAGERVFVTSGYVTTTTGSIAIPGGTLNGDYVMRIVADYNSSVPSNPCAILARGEYKDFTFRVVSPPACPPPTTLTATGITATSANLGWTSGASSWNVEVGLPSFTPGMGASVVSVTGTANNPWLASGLTASTAYQFYVQADCGGSGVSTWAGPFAFATQTVVPAPYFEGFPVTTTPAGYNITGWTIGSIRGVLGNPANNIYKNMWSSGATGTFTTVNVGPISAGMLLTFDYITANFSSPFAPPVVGSGGYTVEISTDYGVTYTLLETVPNNGVAGYQAKQYDLSAYNGQIVKLRFSAQWISGDYDLAFDNISIAAPPACPNPTALTATAITQTTADLGWTSSASLWNVEVGLSGFTPGMGAAVVSVTGTSNNPWQATGLTPATFYQFYVQSDCGGGALGDWVGPFAFTTECGVISTLPYSESFNAATWPLCWTQTFGGGLISNRWNVNATANAGGTANEMRCSFQNATGISRLIAPIMDLSSAVNPVLEFRHFYDDWGVGATMKIQTSTDGITWVDEAFSILSGGGNVGPATVVVPLTTLSATTYIAWVVDGNHNQLDYWFIDNVVVKETLHATINPMTATYDIAAPADLTTTITWNDATSITAIVDDLSLVLTPNTHYTVVGNTLTILDAYLSTVLTNAGDDVVLTITFNLGVATFTITAIETVVVDATINPVTADYDLTIPADVATTVTWNDANSITSIVDDQALPVVLTANTHYTVVGNTLTILDAYLSTVLTNAGDDVVLTISFDAGADATFTITAIETVPVVVDATINPVTANYDLTIPADVATTVTWNDATSITTIFDDQALPFELVANTHYTLVGNTLTILDAYLSTVLLAAADDIVLTISFDAGADATFTITAIETVPVVVVAHWNFEDAVKQAAITDNATFFSAAYTADNGIAANVDVAPITLVGGSTFDQWVQGYLGAVATVGAPNAVNWDNGNDSKYWMVTIATTGYENLTLSSRQRGSNTGPRDMKVQYSTDGLAWTDVPTATVTIANNWTSAVLDEVELPSACENQPTLMLRWIMTSNVSVNAGVVAAGGTSRIDEILVTGTDVTVSVPEFATDVKVYPNPSNGQFVVESSSNWTMMVYDITGRIVASQLITVGSNEVNLLNQPSGLYFVRLFNKEQSQTIRIVIE